MLDGVVAGEGMNDTNRSLNVRTLYRKSVRSLGTLETPSMPLSRKLIRSLILRQGTAHAETLALQQFLSKYSRADLQRTSLYVTVEPCIMCASLLRQYRIRSVYYGCKNDKFGGNGGVLRVHEE